MIQQRAISRRIAVIVLSGLLVVGVTSGALAHEHRQVGDLEFTVGFMNEPAYVNELNGIDLRIARHNGENQDAEDDDEQDGNAVEGAHETLRAAVIYGEETMEVALRPVWGQPGAYTADIIPTATGTYSFQFIGEVDGQEVNETFRGGPDTFSEVQERDALEFPADPPQPAGDTDQAMALGIAGVIAGLLGLVAGAAGYFKASNSESAQQPARQRQRTAQQRTDESSRE